MIAVTVSLTPENGQVRLPQAYHPEDCQRGTLCRRGKWFTIGSTNLTPLSSAGLWLAVIMMPITAFRFFDLTQAVMPTVNMT